MLTVQPLGKAWYNYKSVSGIKNDKKVYLSSLKAVKNVIFSHIYKHL